MLQAVYNGIASLQQEMRETKQIVQPLAPTKVLTPETDWAALRRKLEGKSDVLSDAESAELARNLRILIAKRNLMKAHSVDASVAEPSSDDLPSGEEKSKLCALRPSKGALGSLVRPYANLYEIHLPKRASFAMLLYVAETRSARISAEMIDSGSRRPLKGSHEKTFDSDCNSASGVGFGVCETPCQP